MRGSELQVPAFEIVVNGRPLPREAVDDLVDVTVHQDVTAPDMFALRLVNWDDRALDVTWSDKNTFALGAEIEVRLGYVGALEQVMVGEVTGIEPEFDASRVPMVTVRGHDRGHRLLRGRNTRTFVQMKDSDIVKKVVSDANLSATAVDTERKLDYVLQHDQSDMDFLRERARRIGYEIVVDGKQLHFRPPKLTASPVATLRRERDLIRFHPRLTTMTQVAGTSVRGWDPKKRKEIVGTASASDVTATMQGRHAGPSASEQAFGGDRSDITDRPVTSVGEAGDLAKALIRRTALAYVSGDGTTNGAPAIRAGSVIRIEGVGRNFSGDYYVSAATHSYRPRQGYRTSFSINRTAT